MTSLEMDIETVENFIETWSYEWRNAQASKHHKDKWAKQIHRELNWLRENAPGHYLLQQDFSDIKVH